MSSIMITGKIEYGSFPDVSTFLEAIDKTKEVLVFPPMVLTVDGEIQTDKVTIEFYEGIRKKPDCMAILASKINRL